MTLRCELPVLVVAGGTRAGGGHGSSVEVVSVLEAVNCSEVHIV